MAMRYRPIANLRNFGQTRTRRPARMEIIAERVNTIDAIIS